MADVNLTSVIRYVRALDTSSTTGAGKTGLAFGDITAKYLTQGGTLTSLTTEDVTTLGTFQAPTSAAHVRIKELASAAPTDGVYEVHFHDTTVAATGKKLWLFLSATGARFETLEVDLIPYKADVQTWTAEAIPATATTGVPIVNTKYVNNTSQTARDLGAVIPTILKGTATSGSTSTTLNHNLSSAAGLVGMNISIVGGTGAYQTRTIIGDSGGGTLTIHPAWAVTPDNTSQFEVVLQRSPRTDENLRVDLSAIAGQTATASGSVTFAGTIANTTNITGGTITTVTNLTNAPTNGDLTATMKTSVTAAVPSTSAINTALSSAHGSGAWGSDAGGTGSIVVNHDTGGTDNLRFSYNGTGLDNAVIRAYLTDDYDTGDRTIIGQSVTNVEGRWATDMMLDANDYTITFEKDGYQLTVVEVTVA